MIHVMAVDDEQPALRRVGNLLQSLEGVQVSGLFDSATLFLEHILTASEPIDLILLDMEMPGMHGIELARRLRKLRPEIHIAFLTAYEEFAREAFEVEALDYLLKPIMKEDLARTLGRIVKRSPPSDVVVTGSVQPGVSIRRFGPFAVNLDGQAEIRFRNSKGRELLAYLHHHGGKFVSKSQIMDDIWYGADVERTQVNLHSTVYQLRKDLEACGLFEVVVHTKTAGGSYGLRWPIVYDDVAAFENEYRLYKQTASLTPVLRAIQLYGDGYLAGSGYGWAAARQAELEIGCLELLEAMVDIYVRQQRYEIALGPMQKWVLLLPLDTRIHAKMIALLLLMNREADARDYHELALELLDPKDLNGELCYASIAEDPYALF